jgi:hypothetical protein
VFVDALTRKWYEVQKYPHAPEWDDLEEFLAWCRLSGYEPYDILRRVNVRKPYGPDNCYWKSPAHTPETADSGAQEFILRWNKTVNIFRRHCGLPLFREE